MEYIDEIKGPLNAMLLPARWKGLRRNEIDRVMTSLINAWLFKYPPQWYLRKITDILALRENLEGYVPERYENETDENIREFLQDLALEIERQYPNVARSGRPAKTSGYWVSDESSTDVVNMVAEQVLPYINRKEVVWELQERLPDSSTDALLEEFQKYYHRRTMKGKTRYEEPIEFASFSVSRFKKKCSSGLNGEIAELSAAMASNRNHPMHENIKIRTEYDFTSSEHDWNWYAELLNDIHDGLMQSST